MKLFFIIIFSSLFLFGCNDKNFDEIVRDLSAEKTKIEQNIRDIKDKRKNGKITEEQYLMIRKQYGERQATFNSLIAQLKVALVSGKNPEEIATNLKTEITKNETFFQSIEALSVVGAGATIGYLPKALLIEFVIPLTQTIIKHIFEEYRLARQERRDQIIQILEDQKWHDFDNVK